MDTLFLRKNLFTWKTNYIPPFDYNYKIDEDGEKIFRFCKKKIPYNHSFFQQNFPLQKKDFPKTKHLKIKKTFTRNQTNAGKTL